MNLHEVHRGITKYKKRKRIGRGTGSGRGKTASKGHKGQMSRPGYSALPIFEGGAMPLVRRVPKRGFNNKYALAVAAVNVGDLEAAFDSGDEVTMASLKEKSLAKGRYDILKILGDGALTKKLKISAHRFSKSALAKIEQAGGQAIVVPGRNPVSVKQKNMAKATS